jgi:uncharacterized protein (DUF2141 family)
MRVLLAGLLLLLAAVPAGLNANSGVTLTVTLTGGKPGEGEFVVGLFDNQKTWLKDVVAEVRVPVDEDGGAVVSFEGLPAGTFAISTYQDCNGNGQLDRLVVFGPPREPYAFSNEARGMFGPAKFEDAAFEIGDEDQELAIRFP